MLLSGWIIGKTKRDNNFEELVKCMTEKRYTVRDLASHLLHLIETGNGEKLVMVSVVYDDCEHIQYLKNVHNFDGWVTITGGNDEREEISSD